MEREYSEIISEDIFSIAKIENPSEDIQLAYIKK
jgi:hypothetical protein